MGIIRISSSPEVHTMYLKRKVDAFLCAWKADPERKPLIIKGCRQVGKTESVKQFAEKNYESVIEINFIRDEKYKGILADGYEASAIIKNISLIDPSKKFIPNKTLLFFDEITEFPEIATALKFFFLDGRFDVICSGSMLGVNYRKIESNSVGYKKDFEMFSMDFEEFLIANGIGEFVMQTMRMHFEKRQSLPDALHAKILDLFKKYLIVGGLPDAVNTFVEQHNVVAIRKIQEDIHALYGLDASKYEKEHARLKIQRIYNLIPSNLENRKKRIIAKSIEDKKGKRMTDYEDEFDYLISAGVALEVRAISVPSYPLMENCGKNLLKLYLNDVGLLTGLFF